MNILREIAIPQMPLWLSACNMAMRPIQVVIDRPKVVRTALGRWEKIAPSKSLLVLTISYLALIVFSPLIIVACLVKATNQKPRQISNWYQFEKKEAYFKGLGYTIVETQRSELTGFALHLQPESKTASPSSFWLAFDCWGKLRYKQLECAHKVISSS